MHETEKKFHEINFFNLVVHLEAEEMYSRLVYDDATSKQIDWRPVCQGNPTIGIGFNLAAGISQEVARKLCRWQVEEIDDELKNYAWYRSCSPARKEVLLEVAFNAGVSGLFGFRKMIRAIDAGEWIGAALELMDSEAARGRPKRYERMKAKWLAG